MGAMKHPRPTKLSMKPADSSSSQARFTGMTLILSSLATVRMGGRASPLFKRPSRIWAQSWSKSCR